jgi:hypothetical protein
MEGSMSDKVESMADDPRREEELAEAILAYLAEHPRAMDTLKGIAEWWLLRRQVSVEVLRVDRALRNLTDCGLLEKVGTGHSCLYRARAGGPGPGQATE